MAKLGRILGFAAITGTILGGLYYFFIRNEDEAKEGEAPKENEIKNFFDEMPSREYVSLNREVSESESENESESRKESIREKIDQSVQEKEAKKREQEEGVGLVKEEVNTSEPEFKDLKADEEAGDRDE